jgi:hypothetical protein
MPNPSSNYFTLTIRGGNLSEAITLQVTDALGRVVEQRTNLQTNSNIQIGSNYKPGMYLVQITQGSVHEQAKLIKL